jgi:hypothetical protein
MSSQTNSIKWNYKTSSWYKNSQDMTSRIRGQRDSQNGIKYSNIDVSNQYWNSYNTSF